MEEGVNRLFRSLTIEINKACTVGSSVSTWNPKSFFINENDRISYYKESHGCKDKQEYPCFKCLLIINVYQETYKCRNPLFFGTQIEHLMNLRIGKLEEQISKINDNMCKLNEDIRRIAQFLDHVIIKGGEVNKEEGYIFVNNNMVEDCLNNTK